MATRLVDRPVVCNHHRRCAPRTKDLRVRGRAGYGCTRGVYQVAFECFDAVEHVVWYRNLGVPNHLAFECSFDVVAAVDNAHTAAPHARQVANEWPCPWML